MTLILLYKNEKEVDALVSTIADRFRDTWIYGKSEIELNAEIRVAYVPEEFNDVTLLTELTESNSDIETPGVRVFRGDELDSFKRKAQVEEALKKALEEDTFQVYYQPIWNAEKNRMESAEALIRLTDPELGFISPEEFIPIAEQSGLITEIGLYVFEKVCQFITKERTRALGLRYIEVNLSVFQLLVGNTLEHFLEIMKRYGVTSDQINLEITETGSLATSNTMISAINEMQEWGFKFSLDDYGTGYSNLSYIMSMDFLNIKSDKGLLWDADTRESSSIMLTDTIKTIRRLGMNVIQEGVETKEQLDLVVGAGANLIQGYYFSKPLPEEAFYDYMIEFIKKSIINR
ncbi:MAG: EAL domain-containing protein [Lachnospiraceae bacterium]|nr:EAL domain-containing protein [Lachnospiraceae bacterium]